MPNAVGFEPTASDCLYQFLAQTPAEVCASSGVDLYPRYYHQSGGISSDRIPGLIEHGVRDVEPVPCQRNTFPSSVPFRAIPRLVVMRRHWTYPVATAGVAAAMRRTHLSESVATKRYRVDVVSRERHRIGIRKIRIDVTTADPADIRVPAESRSCSAIVPTVHIPAGAVWPMGHFLPPSEPPASAEVLPAGSPAPGPAHAPGQGFPELRFVRTDPAAQLRTVVPCQGLRR